MSVRGTVFQQSRSLQLSIPGHGSAPSPPHASGWPSRSHMAPSALPPSARIRFKSGWLGWAPPTCPEPPAPVTHWTSDFQTISYSTPCGDFISCPSFGVIVSTFFCQFPGIFYLLLAANCIRAKVPSNARTSRVGICLLPLAQALYPRYVVSP